MTAATGREGGGPLARGVRFLSVHRHLIYEMAMRDIRNRYTRRAFGMLWSILSPLALMVVYLLVFSFIFSFRLETLGDFGGDYTSLLLSGLVPWIVLQDAVMRSLGSFTAEPGLVRQLAFPTAVLPIKTVLSCAPLVLTTTAFCFIYTFAVGNPPPATAYLVPLYWIMFAIFVIGLAFLLATLAVFLPDVQEFLGIVFSAGLFLSPILFIPGLTPAWLERAFYFNPFSYVIWPHKDLVFYGRIEHPWAWVGFFVLTLTVSLLGAYVFNKAKSRFGDAL